MNVLTNFSRMTAAARLYTLAVVAVSTLGVSTAEPTVSNVTAKQRYPWNGLVDVDCTVSGIDGTTNGVSFALAAVIPDSGDVRNVSQFWVVQGGTNSTDKRVYVNGDYRIVWDAQADLGAVIYSNMVVRVTTVKEHAKVQLWKDGPYWATTNIGAEKPEECGSYFWWGDIVGHRPSGKRFDFDFAMENPAVHTANRDINALLNEGWIVQQGDDAYVLAPEYDAAQAQWGDGWRIPTDRELEDLGVECDWTWTMVNGVNGYEVRGRGDYAANRIFLPCAGAGYGQYFSDTDPYGSYWAGSGGAYWSSAPPHSNEDHNADDSRDAYVMFLGPDYFFTSFDERAFGFSVRPVQGGTD